jgi:phosphomannomutase
MKEGIFTHRQQHPLQRIRANETCAFRKREKERKKERKIEIEGREREERGERGERGMREGYLLLLRMNNNYCYSVEFGLCSWLQQRISVKTKIVVFFTV